MSEPFKPLTMSLSEFTEIQSRAAAVASRPECTVKEAESWRLLKEINAQSVRAERAERRLRHLTEWLGHRHTEHGDTYVTIKAVLEITTLQPNAETP